MYNFYEDGLLGLGWGLFSILLYLVFYLIGTVPYYVLGNKAGYDKSWFAFIPILNIVLVIRVAQESLWFLLLLIIPFVNIVASIYLMYKFIKAFGRSGLEIILLIIPVVNLVYLYYLAFSNNVRYVLYLR
ncbi:MULTISPECIES: DUF5684 domain-containing protein [unclassified Paenibacillus]|uniref:DUF5684 domain-containing protein n=1 Tax=unclassified Paenibacillus TaxID=185978 RepID=UPI001EF5165B|nr:MULTISPECIES: DUF5684 domain-containing protein [unclassified Paenibacillus]MDK8181686.1 DUF5684 domain-containing protein [Paenibacillus sp. UMB4589-SE434]